MPIAITGIVLLTTSNGDNSAILETAIVTPAMGDIDLAMPLTSWTGQAMTIISQLTAFAAWGRRELNAKNAALADPVIMEARARRAHITTSMTIPPAFSMDAAHPIMELMPPDSLSPSANTKAQMISATVDVKTLPMPWKKILVLATQSLKLRLVARSMKKLINIQRNIQVISSSLTPV